MAFFDLFPKKKTIFGIPVGPTEEAKGKRSAERFSEAQRVAEIAKGPLASAVSQAGLLESTRRAEQEKLKKRRRGASAATIGFGLGEGNIGRLRLGA